MGSLKTEHCSTFFSPEDETLPVEVFVKILESTFSEMSTDSDKVMQAKECLDSNTISDEIMTEVEKQKTWTGLKDFLIGTFSKEKACKPK